MSQMTKRSVINGEMLKKILRRKGITQSALAAAGRIQPSSVSLLTREVICPGERLREKLVAGLEGLGFSKSEIRRVLRSEAANDHQT